LDISGTMAVGHRSLLVVGKFVFLTVLWSCVDE
jgi:hypothetical protein